MMAGHRILKALLLVELILLPLSAFAQGSGNTRSLDDFTGAVTVTTKGISTIPNLTLGRPAAIFNMTAEKNDLSFEPEFRFGLDGEPWSFLFWWRYDLVRTGRFRLDVGAHPAISFAPLYFSDDGVTREVTEARRFLAGELSTGYQIARNVSVGAYYLYSHGFERSVPSNINYFSLSGTVSNIGLAGGFALSFRPQVYYLSIDAQEGCYATLTTTLSNRNVPLSIASILNTPIQTGISGSPDFLWNVSLTYTFDLVD